MQYRRKRAPSAGRRPLHFAVQISKALEHAHEKGIVHRDIKPQNIMILKDGTIKVADFGIAALESAQEKKSDQTVGSVHYIAPEQARGEQPDPRSDIYSLGVVMYEMLTGKMPYDGDTAEQVAMKHITGHPVPPQELNPDIPEELAAITLKAMNSDINARYQSASELLRDLEDFRKQQAAAKPRQRLRRGLGDTRRHNARRAPHRQVRRAQQGEIRPQKAQVQEGKHPLRRLRRAGVPHRRVRFPLELLAA